MRLDGASPAAIDQAAERLAAGGLVAFATETVYGLGADACNDQAVAAIFAAKGRPSDHPLIVHLLDAQTAPYFAGELPQVARRLMQAFWPGPLTLIVPRREGVAQAAAGGQDSIGLRCPSHPVAQALLRACAALQPPVLGLAAPSANLFGRVSPTTAAHVQAQLGAGLLVLDGGACAVGIESAIVDCTRSQPVLLRPGVLTQAQIEAACGERLARPHEVPQAAPRASGTLPSHYAPRARVRLMDPIALSQALDARALAPQAQTLAVWSRALPRPHPGAAIVHRLMPPTPAQAAHELFAVLHDFDTQGVQEIWIEQVPQSPEWAGVQDRLQRAAAVP